MSINISKIRREKMLQTLKELRKELQNNPDTCNMLIEIENELKSKKYGLIWEEHEEPVDENLREYIPVFSEKKSKKINKIENGLYNFILEGDNLHSLYLLNKTHRGKVDFIYIDPPYNTGNNDFVYSDAYVGEDDLYKHSKWLSFMKKRLLIAKGLLTRTGIMCISIDEHEVGTLKLLCDELFDEKNVEILIWRKNGKQGNTKKINRFKNTHEYIIVAYKNKNATNLGKMKILPTWNSTSNPDKDPRGNWMSGNISKEEEKSRPESPNYYTVTTPTGKEYTREWFISKEEFNELDNDKLENEDGVLVGRIYYASDGNGVPRIKRFEQEEQEFYFDTIIDNMGTFTDAKEELKELFGDRDIFDTPKPVKMIKELIRISTPKKKAVVLDFFAGSGTTGQAVIELNNEDKGSRQFILCTNNENDICEKITYERIKKVINGYSNKQGIKANLKYFKTDYIKRFNSDDDDYYIVNELSKYIKELVELENAIDMSNPSIQTIFDDEQADELFSNEELLEKCKKIYLDRTVMLTQKQNELINEYKIKLLNIPEYYFENEIMEVEGW